MRVVSNRLQYQDFDHTSLPPAFFRCFQVALQQPHCLKNGAVRIVALIAGQEHPAQGDVIEFAQVAEVVVNEQSLLTRPAQGFT